MKKFDEGKYHSLLEKLEAVEIPLSYVSSNNDVFRFDSNYFLKEFLQGENLIRRKKFDKLKNLSVDIKSFGAYSLNNEVEYLEKGIPFIRGVDMKNSTINFDNIIYISETANKLLWKSEIKPEMVLLSMSGTIGDVAIALKDWKYPINSSQDLVKIDTNWLVNPYYLYCFLLTKFGKNYFKREARGSVQQHIFLSQIEQFEIPILKDDFVEKIEIIIKQGHSKLEKSKSLYSQAEQTLLQHLGLSNWQPTEKNTAVKNFSVSFGNNGRLDAEYYQPKYDELFKVLKKVKCLKLSDLVNFKKSIEPGSAAYQTEGIPFIRVSDISKFGISQPEHHLDRKEFDLEELKPKKDTILLTKDGSVGIACKVEKDLDVITSGALLHLTLKSNEVLPDYLTLVLNSKLAQMQAERDAGGSIIQHWRPDEIKQVVIPILPIATQKELTEQIKNSFKLREESTRLIETAKQAVEIAIEKNEKEAMDYINKNR